MSGGISKHEPWYPTIFVLCVICVLIVIHLAAYFLGHTTIHNRYNEEVKFWLPPISLTGNHPPEYFLYLFATTASAIYAITSICRLNGRVNAILNRLYDTRRHAQPETQIYPRRAAREHSRRAESLEATGEDHHSDCTLDVVHASDLRRGGLWRRPLLMLAAFFAVVAACGFSLQGLAPVQRNALETIGSECRVLERPKSVGESLTAGLKDIANNPPGFIPPHSPVMAQAGPDDTKTTDGAEERLLAPRRRLEPEVSELEERLVKLVRQIDPSRPRWRTEEPPPDPNGPRRVYCPRLHLIQPTATTGAHAIGALAMFIAGMLSMGCFTAWLIFRMLRMSCNCRKPVLIRPSFASLIFKLIFAIVPWLKPLEYFRDNLLKHVSLIELSGLVQRFVVLCLMGYICTLGFELKSLRDHTRLLNLEAEY